MFGRCSPSSPAIHQDTCETYRHICFSLCVFAYLLGMVVCKTSLQQWKKYWIVRWLSILVSLSLTQPQASHRGTFLISKTTEASISLTVVYCLEVFMHWRCTNALLRLFMLVVVRDGRRSLKCVRTRLRFFLESLLESLRCSRVPVGICSDLPLFACC